MTPKLSEELRQALADQAGAPLQIEDPITQARYILIQADVYEQLQRAMDYDTSDPNPRDYYSLFAKAVKDELDHPGVETEQARTIPGKPS